MLHCCFKFQKIFLSLRSSNRCANFPILWKITFVHALFMSCLLLGGARGAKVHFKYKEYYINSFRGAFS